MDDLQDINVHDDEVEHEGLTKVLPEQQEVDVQESDENGTKVVTENEAHEDQDLESSESSECEPDEETRERQGSSDEIDPEATESEDAPEQTGHVRRCAVNSLMEEMAAAEQRELGRPAPAPAARTESEPCIIISMAPHLLRGWNIHEYTPQWVHIGPIHRQPTHWTENVKKDRLWRVLFRGNDQQQRRDIVQGCLDAVAAMDGRARQCYSMKFGEEISRVDDFAHMLLLDGLFVLSCYVTADASDADYIYNRDLIFLLENQVPLFILEEIYKRLVAPQADDPQDNNNDLFVVQNIARHIEKSVVHPYLYVHRDVNWNHLAPCGRPFHLLHLLYMYFRPVKLNSPVASSGSTADADEELPPWRSATYYYVAGVRLVKRELDGKQARSIVDVDLQGHRLLVPFLYIQGSTLTMLHNMVALEQQGNHPGMGTHYIAFYCNFLSKLASTEDDVKLLSRKGIIKHNFNKDSELADCLSNLSRGTRLNFNDEHCNYLKPIQERIEDLCDDNCRRSMAWLCHDKCNNILMKVGVGAAIIVFLLTLEQSIYAALSYAKGN